MPEYKIEKGIPIPQANIKKHESGKRREGKKCKYPWAEMEVGDSFFAEGTGPTIYAAAKGWCLRHELPFDFLTKKVENGMRVWRIQ